LTLYAGFYYIAYNYVFWCSANCFKFKLSKLATAEDKINKHKVLKQDLNYEAVADELTKC